MHYVILGALVGAFVMATVQLATGLRVYRGASERRPRNVSVEQRQPPSAVRQLLGELTVLGFRRLGETELSVPDTGVIGSLLGRQRRSTSWLLVDSVATTVAEVTEIGPMVSLESWMVDDSVVQTTTPMGEDIDEPDLRTTAVKGSVAEAYTHHRLMVDGRAAIHGAPRGIHSMGDHLRNDADYRQRFGRRFLRRALFNNQVLPWAVTLVLVVGATIWLLDALGPQ